MAKGDFSKFSGPNGRPTEAERRLIAASAEGAPAVCDDLSDEGRLVAAELIVALGAKQFRHTTYAPDWTLHDRGLTLQGAIIQERLQASERVFPASLIFLRCRFENAVDFTDAKVDGNLVFDGCTLLGKSTFVDAEITAQFSACPVDAQRAEFRNAGGFAILAQGVTASDWFMHGALVDGGFHINSATIAGQFAATVGHGQRAEFRSAGGFAIMAQGVTADAWFMHGALVEGEFNFNSATIAGQFAATAVGEHRAEFRNAGGTAIHAQNVKAADWFMHGALVEGEFNFHSAKIAGQFAGVAYGEYRTEFLNPNGVAIRGDYARIDGGFWLAAGGGYPGAIIQGRLDLSHAWIGMVLVLAGADLDCGETEGHYAVRLVMARIEGRLAMPMTTPRGIIDLSRAFCDTLDDHHEGWPLPLDRDCTTCGRATVQSETREDVDIQHLVLDGFTYNHLEVPDGSAGGKPGEARIRWLSGQSAKALKQQFDPQPWRQCAKTLREMGYDEAAQRISIERRVRERFADGTGPWARFVSWFLHAVADYGFNPWKAVAVSLGFIMLCAGLFWGGARACDGLDTWDEKARVACAGQPAFLQTRFNDFEELPLRDRQGRIRLDAEGKPMKGRPHYPEFRPLAYSLDVFLPVLDLGSESFWRANTRAWWHGWPLGWALYVLAIFQAIFGTVLIAIIVTGFTGLLTRDEK